MKLRSHLIALVIAALLPVILFAGVMIYVSYQGQRANVERSMLDTARALSLAVDRELEASIRTLQALGASERLESRDLKRFYEQARRVLKTQQDWTTIVLFDSNERQLLNLLRPFGSPLPTPPAGLGIGNTIKLKRPLVSDLFFGRVARELRIAVTVPVIRNGKVKYVLAAPALPAFLVKLLKEQNVPEDWLATIIDRNKIIVARTRNLEQFLSKPATPLFPAKSSEAEDAWFRGVPHDGPPVYAGFHRSSLSGWTVELAIPASAIEGSLRRSLLLTGIGGLLLLGVGTGLATVVGRRISRSAAHLSAGAQALGKGDPPRVQPSPIFELDQVAREIEMAAVSRKQMEEELRRSLERIEALRAIEQAITSSLDLYSVLHILLEKIELFLPIVTAGTVRLLNRETGRFEFLACRGVDEQEWNADRLGSRSRKIVATKSPLAVLNLDADPLTHNREVFRKYGLVSYLGVPLIAKDEVLGVLSIYTNQEHEFNEEEVEFITTLATQGAIAIYNAQLYEEIKRQAAALEKANADLRRREQVERLLKELSQNIVSLDAASLLDKLTARVREVFEVDVCDVRLLVDGDRWRLGGISGVDSNLFASSRSGAAYGRMRWIIENQKPLIIADSTKEGALPPGDTIRTLGLRGYLGVPLLFRGEVLGVLRALTYQPRNFIQEEVDLLQQLANGAAVALDNARLYDRTKNQALELARVNKIKDEFLSMMSHELRTPLSVVTGYAGLIKDRMLGEINPQQEEALQKVLGRAGEQLNMINDLMQTTQLEARAVAVERQRVDVLDLLDGLRSDYDLRLYKKDVSLIWDYPSGPMPITTDGAKLKQILQNLINNAIKFTDKGNVKIAVEVRSQDSRFIEFKVQDTGVGIPKDQQAAIFGKFYQVDSSETRLYGGVGLGLYIVKNFTDLLGGTIEVESEPGEGTTFTVRLPA